MKEIFFLVLIFAFGKGQDGPKIQISKCCRENEIIVKGKTCVKHNKTLDFTSLDLFDEDLVKSDHSFNEKYDLVIDDFDLKSAVYLSSKNTDVFLTQDGTFYQKFSQPNAFSRWSIIKLDKVCLDHLQLNNGDLAPKFYAIIEAATNSQQKDIYYTTTSLISCIFLALVLLVYWTLPELRSLSGFILMSYVGSLLSAFLLLSALTLTITFNPSFIEYTSCMTFTASIYYFFLAAFCWVNVMSYDIWWTFRGYAKVLVNRQGVWHKYLKYCAYAWGAPALMTSAVVILNHLDLTDIPWFIGPNIYKSFGCFLSGGEKLLYLYVPMLILILSNCVFFCMTAYNVWKVYRGTEELSMNPDSSVTHRTHKHRFVLYIKLSVIMGISWILEVVSFYKPNSAMWYITDTYNLLIGVFIFLIFVCKKKVYVKLRNKFNGRGPSKYKTSKYSKTTTSTATDTYC